MAATTPLPPSQTTDWTGMAFKSTQIEDQTGLAINTTDVINTTERRNAQVTATGSVLADAAALSQGFQTVTGADATKGVKLPTAPTAGTRVEVKSVTAAVLKVWPDAAATINAIGSNGALSMASLTSAIFIADSPTQWYTIPLLPS